MVYNIYMAEDNVPGFIKAIARAAGSAPAPNVVGEDVGKAEEKVLEDLVNGASGKRLYLETGEGQYNPIGGTEALGSTLNVLFKRKEITTADGSTRMDPVPADYKLVDRKIEGATEKIEVTTEGEGATGRKLRFRLFRK